MRIVFVLVSALLMNMAFAQRRCVESGEIRKWAEVMPRPDVSYNEIQFRLISEFTPTELGMSEGDVLTLSCMVNCRGDSFDFTASGLKNRKLEAKIQNLFSDLHWFPAEDRGKFVDCMTSCSFKVIESEFRMIWANKVPGKRQRSR
ncbi:MAG: hypothetical protein HKO93_01260 [Flavobacteriales bacterium]|nr:hypothetical protein [Flavobacteriales bacterium]